MKPKSYIDGNLELLMLQLYVYTFINNANPAVRSVLEDMYYY